MIELDTKKLETVVDRRIGRPFCWGARGPEEFYCLGLYLDLLEQVAGIRIEDPFSIEAPAIFAFWRRFLRLPSFGDLRPLDVLFWHHGDAAQAHVSIVESGKWAVTVEAPDGVARKRLAEEVRRAECAYRLKELL